MNRTDQIVDWIDRGCVIQSSVYQTSHFLPFLNCPAFLSGRSLWTLNKTRDQLALISGVCMPAYYARLPCVFSLANALPRCCLTLAFMSAGD